MVRPNAPAEIYQLHILLLQINPPIWRRLHVRSDSSIATLHLELAYESERRSEQRYGSKYLNDTRLTTNQGVTAMTNTNTDIKQIAGGNLYD